MGLFDDLVRLGDQVRVFDDFALLGFLKPRILKCPPFRGGYYRGTTCTTRSATLRICASRAAHSTAVCEQDEPSTPTTIPRFVCWADIGVPSAWVYYRR